jgi:hypothetical protein
VQKAPRRVSPKIKNTRKRTAKISRTQKLRRLVRGLVTYRHAHERPKRPTREILAPPRTARPQRTAAVNMSAAEAREKINVESKGNARPTMPCAIVKATRTRGRALVHRCATEVLH